MGSHSVSGQRAYAQPAGEIIRWRQGVSWQMEAITRNSSVLILSPKMIDARTTNDFPSCNVKQKMKYFPGCQVFYFYEALLDYGMRETRRQIEEIAISNNISLLFFEPNGSNYELPIAFFKELKNRVPLKVVLWVLDDEMIFDTLSKYYAQVCDAAITCDYYATFAYRKLGVPALYYFSSFSKKEYSPVDVKQDIDVSFVGDCTKSERGEVVEYLRSQGFHVEGFGKGSEHGFVKKEELSEIFSRSKINLNFTKVDRHTVDAWYLEDNPLTRIVRQNKGRPMEVAMTNSFCLSEYSPSLSAVFEIGKDLDVFYDKRDLELKVRYYLEHEERRREMARNAYNKAVSVYEADIFMPKLFDELCWVLNGADDWRRNEEIYVSSVFKRNHINQLTFVMWYQLLRVKILPGIETFLELFQYGLRIFVISFLKGSKRMIVKGAMRVLTDWKDREK